MSKSKDNEAEGWGNDEVQAACTKVKTLISRTSGRTAFPASLLETRVFTTLRGCSEGEVALKTVGHIRTAKWSCEFYTQGKSLLLEAHPGIAQKEKTQLKVYVQGQCIPACSLVKAEHEFWMLFIKGRGEQILIYTTDGQTAEKYNNRRGCI